LDVRDKVAIDELFRNHREELSQVDVLINSAGLAFGREPIQEGNPEEWDVVIDTNVKGLLYVTRAFLPQMIAKGGGHIVNMGSAAGHWAYPSGNIYSATKFAVRALTESLRMDLNGTGIRVSEVSPGMVETEFSDVRFKGDQQKAKSVYAGMTPLTATDVAETILWCVQRPAHVNIQEVVIFPTDQASVGLVKRR
jgi:NADP-dependent 3-hydroxy acid dehydrogenase YdfG